MIAGEIPVEYSPYYWDDKEVFGLKRGWRASVEKWLARAYHHAKEIEANGHQAVRIVLDTEWEYALTCDDCMLWANVTRKLSHRKHSYDSASGDLLEVVSCDPDELHRRFGEPSDGSNAWDGYTAWTVEPWYNVDLVMSDLREVRKTGSGGWKKLRKVFIEEAEDEDTTEESGG